MGKDLSRLADFLDYNPETGVFTWKTTRGRIIAGSIAGQIRKGGHRMISYNGRKWQASHLAWYLTHGVIPKEIDHINRVRHDDALSNLRECTHAQNMYNRDLPLGKSGFRGVRKDKNKWEARLTVNRQGLSLGFFDTPEDAYDVYKRFAKFFHGEFVRAA